MFRKKKKKAKPRPKTRKTKPAKRVDPAKAARQKKRMQLSLGLVAGALAVLGLIVGLAFLRNRALRQSVPAITDVILANQPDWMEDTTADEICQVVLELAAQDPSDLNLPAKAAVRLVQNPWVKRVLPVGVVNDRHGALVIRCEFRKPFAAVNSGGFFVRVDDEAIVLPDRLLLSRVKTIIGVRSEAPEAGQLWDSPELLAAVQLLRLIDGRPFSREIAVVDVSNYDGRRKRSKPHIVLLTDERSELRWGRAIGAEGRIEVNSMQKLQHLEALFTEYGSLNKILYVRLTGREPLGILRDGKRIEGR